MPDSNLLAVKVFTTVTTHHEASRETLKKGTNTSYCNRMV
jgi:hypothetical protein